MEITPRQVRSYRTPNGRCPFREWLAALRDRKARAIIRTRIDRLSLGNWGDCRHLGEGLHELRIHYGPGYRVYLGEADQEIVILLCGGSKGTQSRDIAKAQSYWRELRG